MQLTIEKIVYPGKSLGRNDGKVIFTNEGLPGESGEVEIQQEKKRFAEAVTQKILTPSADRVAPRCEHFHTCGSYQYISYSSQLALKHQQLREIVRENLKNGVDLPPLEPSPQAWGYRNKLQAQLLLQKDGTCIAAYHQPQAHHRFVAFTACALVSDRMNQALAKVCALISQSRAMHVRELIIRESRIQDKLMLLLRGPTAVSNNALARGLEALQQTDNVASALFQTIPGRRITPLFGENLLTEEIDGKTFFFGAASFLQVNMGILQALIAYVRTSLSISAQHRVIDLYAGIGTFGLSLGESSAAAVFVESDPENVAFLKRNATAAKTKNRRVFAGRAEAATARLNLQKSDILIVDPPRSGLDPQLCRQLCRKPVSALVYVSCDPMTLSRDLKTLSPAYQLTHIKAFDFFPQTPHIETCCILHSR